MSSTSIIFDLQWGDRLLDIHQIKKLGQIEDSPFRDCFSCYERVTGIETEK